MNITHKKLEAINGKPYEGKAEIPDEDGLAIRISPKGKISFTFRARLNGKQIRYKIGTFPEMSLKEAREKALEDKSFVDHGTDPRTRGLLVAENKVFTIGEALNYWLNEYAKVNRDDPYAPENAFKLIPDAWLKVNVEHMSTVDWSNLYKDIAKNNNKGHGRYCIAESRTALRYCATEGLVKRVDFEPLKPSNYCQPYDERERALDPDEIGEVLRNINETSLGERNQLLFMVALIYGCRVNELALAEVVHIDLEKRLWTVPKENLKGGSSKIYKKIKKDLRRPIPEKAIPIFKRLLELAKGSKYLVKSRMNPLNPVSPSSLSKISLVLVNELGIKHFVMHDMRRTLATRLTDMGCPPHIPEKIEGRRLQGNQAIYNRSEMLQEIDYWLTVWFDKLMQWKVNPTNIIELHEKRQTAV